MVLVVQKNAISHERYQSICQKKVYGKWSLEWSSQFFFTRNSKVNFILERRLQSKIYDSYLESEVFRVIN